VLTLPTRSGFRVGTLRGTIGHRLEVLGLVDWSKPRQLATRKFPLHKPRLAAGQTLTFWSWRDILASIT